MRLRIGTFTLAGLAAAALAAAAPASAQTFTLTAPEGGIDTGLGNVFTLSITQAPAAAAVQDVTLTVTAPAGSEVAISACQGGVQAPCLIDIPANAGATPVVTEVPITITRAVPEPAETCPTGSEPFGPVSVALSGPVTQTLTASSTLNPYADVQVEVTGPGSAGSNAQYTNKVIIRNVGPCVAEAVEVSITPTTALTFVSFTPIAPTTPVAGSGCVQDNLDPNADDFGACSFGDMAAGASQEFDVTWQAPDPTDDIRRTAFLLTVDAASAPTAATPDGEDPPPTPDPDDTNNSATARTEWDEDDDGCSTGGAGTLLSLIPLLGAAAWRRRRQAR